MRFSFHIFFAFVLLLAGFAVFVAYLNRQPTQTPEFGVTYSTRYAKELGLNWQEAYLAILDDLQPSLLRLPVYWDDVEYQPGVYFWHEIDFMVQQAQQRGAKVTLVLGIKEPRWPECYIPKWADEMKTPGAEERLIKYIEEAVRHFRGYSNIDRWQIENEAFFPFGKCPPTNMNRFTRELEAVHTLDNRPVQLTVSGELDPWVDMAFPADILGISLYRVTWHDLAGFFYYPITPEFYRARARIAEGLVEKIIISELQAEPWFPEPVKNYSIADSYQAFPVENIRKNF